MIKDKKVFLKMLGLILCSLCGITNIVSLLIIAKKTNSRVLKILGWMASIVFVFSIVVFSTTYSTSFMFALAILCACVSIYGPTFLTLFNIVNYKVAHDIAETVKTRRIIPENLEEIDSKQIDVATWIKPKQIKMAKQLYGDKGIAVLIAIDTQVKNEKIIEEKRLADIAEKAEKERVLKVEEEKKKQEDERLKKEQREKEQREFELAKIKAEKEKAEAEAEAKTLQMKREREQREFELAKIKAEKEKAEAEARILQMKNEALSKKEAIKAPQEEGDIVSDKPKKTDKYVFISYSTKDSSIAAKTKEILENSGINCWIAPWSIGAGSDYASEIPKALNGCSAMVLLLSKASQESKWVPKEIGIAIENSKIIIPFQIDNEIISDSFNFYLTNSQRIAAFNRMNDAYDELTQSLYRLLQID